MGGAGVRFSLSPFIMIEPEETNIGVGAILISKYKELILQQRDDIPEIKNPGKISLFGGTLKLNETKWSGLRRELFEELELTFLGAQVEFFKTYQLTKEKDGRDRTIHIYIIKDVDDRKLVLHEGSDIIFERIETVLDLGEKLTDQSFNILKDYKESLKL